MIEILAIATGSLAAALIATYHNYKDAMRERAKYYRLWQAALADRNNAGWEVAQALEDRVAELEGLAALKNQEGIAK